MMSKPSMTSWADAATISKADTRLDIAAIGERNSFAEGFMQPTSLAEARTRNSRQPGFRAGAIDVQQGKRGGPR